MDLIIDFAAKHYIIFIIITIVLVFALIGYFVNIKQNKKTPFKIAADNNKVEEININNLEINNNISLQDAVRDSTTIKKEKNNPESL